MAVNMNNELRQGLWRYGYRVDSDALAYVGRGGYGEVWFATEVATNTPRAIKIIEKTTNNPRVLRREIGNQSSLKHQNVVGLEKVVGIGPYVCLVLEWAGKGDLTRVVKCNGRKLGEAVARKAFQQLVRAVEYIHYMGVFSRDIKPDNVLFTDAHTVKLCDFGLSKNILSGKPVSARGSPHCVAPEVFTQPQYCGQKVDVWGCGVVLYYMLSGRYPFDHGQLGEARNVNEYEEMIRNFVLYEPPVPLPPQISLECQDLIARMLEKDPARRITIAGIQEHPFFHRDLREGLAAWQAESRRLQVSTDNMVHDLEAVGRALQAAALQEATMDEGPWPTIAA